MEQIVVEIDLPVREKLELRKNHIVPAGEDRGKRICVVTGTHGDELEGQLVAYLLNRKIAAHPEYLHGTVDIYPAMNPLGINTISRRIPSLDLDMNRIFPGNEQGAMADYYVSLAAEDMKGADYAIDLHASNIFLREMPQVRILEKFADELLPLARTMNLDLVWIHSAVTVLEGTLAHTLNTAGTKTLVVEMGVGMRLTQEYGEQVSDGILNLMRQEGMWDGEVEVTHHPIVNRDKVAMLHAESAGVFISRTRHSSTVKKGEVLGVIADPSTGKDLEEIISPADGILFTLREYPVVYPGSLLARIITGGTES